VSDWIPKREEAKGRIWTTIRKEIRERKKKSDGGVGERCLSMVPFLLCEALAPGTEPGGYKVLVCGDIDSLPCPVQRSGRDLHPLG